MLISSGMLMFGVWLALVAGAASPVAETELATRTVHSTHTEFSTRYVTVRVAGRVIRRQDHVLTVEVPRYVFRARGRRVVVPAHVVRIRRRPSTPIAAVLGVAPMPVTVTVPIPVPGPTVTETTIVPTTITETTETTITVTVSIPLGD